MRRKKKERRRTERDFRDSDVVEARPLEVSLTQCKGNYNKMIRKFMKKVRKEEVLKPYYERLSHPTSKGQKNRMKRARKAWLEKKRMSKMDEND